MMHSLFSSYLHIHIQGSIDFQTTLIEGISTDLGNYLLANHIKEVTARVVLDLMRGAVNHFFSFGLSSSVGINEAIFNHLVDY